MAGAGRGRQHSCRCQPPADAVIACAEAGVRGISCEKPIAAKLADADAMIAACEERGAAFACGTAWWEVHQVTRIGEWVRDGAIGRLTGAAIDGFLAEGDQVSGLGCVILNFLRFATGDEVAWAEGWTVPEEAAASDDDCAAYGTLGMTGGYECICGARGAGGGRPQGGAVRRGRRRVPGRRRRHGADQGHGDQRAPGTARLSWTSRQTTSGSGGSSWASLTA